MRAVAVAADFNTQREGELMAYLLRRRRLGKTSCEHIAQLSTTGIKVFRNDTPLPEDTLVFRWGCTSNLPGEPKVVNPAVGIHTVADKLGFRAKLNEAELCPETWFEFDALKFPCVIRPSAHHQGRHLYVCPGPIQAAQAIAACTAVSGGWYGAALIEKDAEFRVFVVSGRVVCVARKYPADEKTVAWNVAQGGRFENVRWDDWPLKAVRISLEAFALSELDFGGVDIMVKGDAAFVLEINSAPSLTSPYRQRCFAKAFDYIVEHGKQPIPLIEKRGGYSKFIHPAIYEGALIP